MSQLYRLFSLPVALLVLAQGSEIGFAEHGVTDEAFVAAIRHYQAGQWPSAASAFDQVAQDAIRTKAVRRQAQLYAGECLTQLGKYAEARQRYELVRDEATSATFQAQALFRLGEVAWLAGETDEGARLLQSYVQTYPQGRSISFAREYLRQIEQRSALEADFEVLDDAVGLERVGRYDEALIAYARILRTHVDASKLRAETLRRSALLHQRLAQPQEAIELFQQFLADYPHSKRTAEVMQSIAWNFVRLDQTAQAADQFQAVLEKFPQSAQAAEAAYWLAQRRADEENTEQALVLLGRVLDCDEVASEQPKLLARALNLKCQLCASQDEWQAIEALVEANKEWIASGQFRAQLEFWSAEAAFRLGEYNTARKRFLELQPKTIGVQQPWTAMVPLRRAQLAARRQQWRGVLQILDHMEREFPNFELDYEVDYLRGRALAGIGQMTAARKYYRRVLDNDKGQGTEAATMAGWMTGETYFHQRDYPRARVAYQQVMEKNSFPEWQSRAALQAGKCWELEQRWDEAADVYAAALKRWPHSFSEPQLTSRLRWAQNQSRSNNAIQQR